MLWNALWCFKKIHLGIRFIQRVQILLLQLKVGGFSDGSLIALIRMLLFKWTGFPFHEIELPNF